MSANQIPGKFSARDLRKHDCPTCWKNGGPGHTLAELLTLQAGRPILPAWATRPKSA